MGSLSASRVTGAGSTLIIGSTGFIGRFVTEACLDSGRPTYILVRCGPTSPPKAATAILQGKGATIVHGTINDREFMEKVMREHKIEVVISAIGGESILDQLHLIDAIKNVGTIKRFLPSEFGHDIDRADPVEPGLTMYNQKRNIRRYIEEAEIPYTYICCNSIAAWPYHDNTHPADVLPPLDHFQIYGDGSVKAYFVAGSDIGKFTIKTIDDDRTINKTVHFRPPSNLLNINEMASLWEEKIGRVLPRVTITEDDLLDRAKEMRIPQSIVAAFTHDIFIKGCQINFCLDKPTDVDICSLYPEDHFQSLNECFDDFVKKIVDKNPKAVSNPPSKNGIFVPKSDTELLAITA